MQALNSRTYPFDQVIALFLFDDPKVFTVTVYYNEEYFEFKVKVMKKVIICPIHKQHHIHIFFKRKKILCFFQNTKYRYVIKAKNIV